eukprot:g13968.t1
MGRGWHAVSASLAIADDECLHGRRRQGSIGATGQLQRGAKAGELTPCPSRPSPRAMGLSIPHAFMTCVICCFDSRDNGCSQCSIKDNLRYYQNW